MDEIEQLSDVEEQVEGRPHAPSQRWRYPSAVHAALALSAQQTGPRLGSRHSMTT